MAFKILHSNEIELLTETQRESYEKELAIYNERVRFVEQLEQYENTVITPYEPKLVNISVINKAPEKEFTSPEYVLDNLDPVTKPELKVVAVSFVEPVTAVLPKYSNVKKVPSSHVKKVKQCKPVLPTVLTAVAPLQSFAKTELPSPVLQVSVKTSIPSKSMKRIESARPNLPTTAKPQSFTDLVFAPVVMDSIAIKEKSPKVTTPVLGVSAFVVPEDSVPILPRTEVEIPEVKAYDKLEQTSPVLPKSAVEIPEVKAYDKPEQTTPILPKIEMGLPEVKVYDKLEQTTPVLPKSAVELPEVKVFDVPEQIDLVLPKAIIPNHVNVLFKHANKTKAQLPDVSNKCTVNASFTKLKVQKTELPIAKKVGIPTKKFIHSEHDLSHIPTIDQPKADVHSYIVPDVQKSTIPTFNKAGLVLRPDFKPLVDSTVQIEYPPINVFPVPSFVPVSSKVSSLPTFNSVTIPSANADEVLKSLLPTKENEIREGALA